ncbi:helix-turn-helix domain-containing protein [Nitriliruptor sp.]
MPTRAGRHLTLEDREEISRGLAAGDSLRQIAGRLGRAQPGEGGARDHR